MYDVLFIGGGLSSTLSLIYLIRHLRDRTSSGELQRPASLRLALIDKSGDFGRGIPYGHFAHPMFLLNNDLATMNVCGFQEWIVAQRERWLGILLATGNGAVQDWLRRNHETLTAALQKPEQYLGIFFPRCIFGLFMEDLLHETLEDAGQCGVKVDLITGEAISLDRQSNGVLRVGLRQERPLESDQVLLGVGSLPPDPELRLEGMSGYVYDIRLADGGQSFKQSLEKALIGKDNPRRVTLIGSNAAAMETLYVIAQHSDLLPSMEEVLVISPSGGLPDAERSGLRRAFVPVHLQRLAAEGHVLAEQLSRAALRDAQAARGSGFSSIDYSAPLCDTFRRVFQRLATEERLRFVENFGMAFTALNRRTPPEYAACAESLRRSGRLRTLAARVTSIQPPRAADSSFTLEMVTAHNSIQQVRTAAVINCQGSGTMASTSDPLLRHILRPESAVAVANRSGRGIAVSPQFEASPGVFVVGPLLAGHSHGSDHLWNLERAERIDSLAARVGPALAGRLESRVGARRN